MVVCMTEKMLHCVVLSGSVVTEGVAVEEGRGCTLSEAEAKRLEALGFVEIDGKEFDPVARKKVPDLRAQVARTAHDLEVLQGELASAETAGGV